MARVSFIGSIFVWYLIIGVIVLLTLSTSIGEAAKWPLYAYEGIKSNVASYTNTIDLIPKMNNNQETGDATTIPVIQQQLTAGEPSGGNINE